MRLQSQGSPGAGGGKNPEHKFLVSRGVGFRCTPKPADAGSLKLSPATIAQHSGARPARAATAMPTAVERITNGCQCSPSTLRAASKLVDDRVFVPSGLCTSEDARKCAGRHEYRNQTYVILSPGLRSVVAHNLAPFEPNTAPVLGCMPSVRPVAVQTGGSTQSGNRFPAEMNACQAAQRAIGVVSECKVGEAADLRA